MIKNEWDLADSENKGKKELLECPMPVKCIEGFPTCQFCIDNAWIEVLNKNPTPSSAFDFDRPDGHAEARKKAGYGAQS